MTWMAKLLEESAGRHSQLCPRQVLGVRMGALACQVLGLDVPNTDKRLVTIVETDGCAADGVSAATGCTVGNRRLRVLDYGKIAATFVDMISDKAIRIVPRDGIRALAQRQVQEVDSRWHTQLKAYQVMSDEELLAVQSVTLSISLEELLSKPDYRVNCEACGEEIINEREVLLEGTLLCRACAGQSYYRFTEEDSTQLIREQPGEGSTGG